jgi:hypothetical protein
VLSTTPGGLDGIYVDLLSKSVCMLAFVRACMRACVHACVLVNHRLSTVKYHTALNDLLGAGEIRETANLINRGNIFQEISEHFLRKTRIVFFIPGEWIKQPHHIA